MNCHPPSGNPCTVSVPNFAGNGPSPRGAEFATDPRIGLGRSQHDGSRVFTTAMAPSPPIEYLVDGFRVCRRMGDAAIYPAPPTLDLRRRLLCSSTGSIGDAAYGLIAALTAVG